MANWEGAAGGALSGAGVGAEIGSIIPGVGTLIGGAAGGLLGGLGGLFGSKHEDDRSAFVDPNRGYEDKLINELSSNKISDTAANAQSGARRSFLDTMEEFRNSRVGNNAAVMAKLGVKANDALGNNLVNIDTADAAQRLRNHEVAGNMLSQQRNFDYGNFRAQQQINSKPSLLEQIGQMGISHLAGAVTGAIGDKIGSSIAGDGAPPPSGGDDHFESGPYKGLMDNNPNPLNYQPQQMHFSGNYGDNYYDQSDGAPWDNITNYPVTPN